MSHISLICRVGLVICLCLIPMSQSFGQPTNKEGLLTKLEKLEPLPIRENEDPLRKLMIQRYNTALQDVDGRIVFINQGLTSLDWEFLSAVKRLADSGLPLSESTEKKVQLLELYWESAKEMEGGYETLLKGEFSGQKGVLASLLRARYERINAEIRLLKAKQELAKENP